MSARKTKYIKQVLNVGRVTDKCLLEKKEITGAKSFGNESNSGDISLVQIGEESVPAILKKIPIYNKENPDDTSTYLGAELKMLDLVTEISDLQITRHFSTVITSSICNKCKYSNRKLNDLGDKCLTLISPFADSGTLKDFLLKNQTISQRDVKNIYFQIFSALYVMQNYFNATHHDLHWSNVFLTKNEYYFPDSYEHYIIQGVDYWLPSFPYVAQVADFGFVRIPGKIEILDLQEYYREPKQSNRNGADFARISGMLWEVKSKLGPETNVFLEKVFEQYRAGSPVASLFPKIFSQYRSLPKNARTFLKWDLDKKVPNFKSELRPYVRREMLKRSRVEMNPSVPPNTPMDDVTFGEACTTIFQDPELNTDDVDMQDEDYVDEDRYRFMRTEAFI